MKERFKNDLIDPPKKFRPIPFWSWNSKLEVNETRWQIAEMDNVGIGGYFMHARGGLKTAYMGKEWFDNVRAALDEGNKRGMGTWGYDENGWPSGFGDGLVSGLGLEYQQKYLRCEILDFLKTDDRTIINVPYQGKRAHLYFDVNEFYVDTLDANVTDKFIEAVHERYKVELGDDFKDLAGFFTDEPQVSRDGIPWSFTMPQKYVEAYGEELLPLLIDLFFDNEGCEKTRYRFWKLVTDLFADNFMGKIYTWCQQNGVKLTGHMVLEETLESQLTSNGACMPNYEYFDIPGMDWLGRHVRDSLTPLQLSSVCNQLGKKQILTESFACCGWDVSFEELKWIFEMQSVRGVNLLCEHLEGYTLEGIRKRDYPPGHFYQQPWWGDYKNLLDSLSRIGMLLAEGKIQFDVLVLHPQASAWLLYNDDDIERSTNIGSINMGLLNLINTLETAQIQFHLGDDRIIERHGKISDAKFELGCQRYSLVIVPPCVTLTRSTLEKLEEFKTKGGMLIFAGEMPIMVDGEKSQRLANLAKNCLNPEVDDIVGAVPNRYKNIKLIINDDKSADGIASTVRYFDDFTMFYFANTRGKECDAVISLNGLSAEEFDFTTGKTKSVKFETTGDIVKINHHFYTMSSVIFFVYSDRRGKSLVEEGKNLVPVNLKLSKTWQISERDDNALTLDYCDCTLGGKFVGNNIPVNNIQEMAIAFEREVEIILDFHVRVKTAPKGKLSLAVENPHRYIIYINGKAIDQDIIGWYRDKTFKTLDVSDSLVVGDNIIKLKTNFSQSQETYEYIKHCYAFESERNKLSYDQEIEAIYLIGDFGVFSPNPAVIVGNGGEEISGDLELDKAPVEVSTGSIIPQGYPFFSGNMTLKNTVTLSADELENRNILFEKRCAVITKIKVNGKQAGTILWQPYEISLQGLLKEGENVIEVELVSSLRNLLGPHHLHEDSFGVGPGSFFHNSPIWSGGLNKRWNDSYVFASLGIFV